MDFESDFELVWVPDVFGLPDLLGVLRVEKEITSSKMQCQLYKQGHEIETEKKNPQLHIDVCGHRWKPTESAQLWTRIYLSLDVLHTHSDTEYFWYFKFSW